MCASVKDIRYCNMLSRGVCMYVCKMYTMCVYWGREVWVLDSVGGMTVIH